MSAITAHAQKPVYNHPVKPLTQQEIFAGKYFDLYSVKSNPPTGQKPTEIRQRMIASAFRRSAGSAAPELQDSSRYKYSGPRGATIVNEFYGVHILAKFDTAITFLKADNFTTAYPLYSQQFNGSRLLHSKRYNPSGDVTEQKWVTYYPDNKIKTSGNLYGDQSTNEWNYEETELNEAGKSVRDSSAAMMAGNFWYFTRTTQYGTNDRKQASNTVSDGPYPGTNEVSRQYFFYAAPTNLLPNKDSTITITTTSGATTTTTGTGIYTYDASDNLLEYTTYTEPGHQPYGKRTYTYDASDRLLSNTYQSYNNLTGTWVNVEKAEYAYNQSINSFYATYN